MNYFSIGVRKIIEIFILMVGITLILYPIWDNYAQDKKHLELMLQWEATRQVSVASTKDIRLLPSLSEHESSIPVVVQEEEDTDIQQEQMDGLEEPIMMDGELVIGAIAIEKIDIYEPMLARTTKKTLKLGIGSVVPEVLPGFEGNFVLAGHRGRTYGKQFNRLDELEEGDHITLETTRNDYTYEIVSKFLVEPDGVFVLDQDLSIQELTLITCDPIRDPTHRLIIKAILVETSAAEETREV